MFQAIGLGPQHDNGKWKASGATLGRQILVHREEKVKFPGIRNKPEQPAVLDAGPSGLRRRRNLMAWQSRGQALGEAFIKENAHSGRQKSLSEDCVYRFLQEPDGLFS